MNWILLLWFISLLFSCKSKVSHHPNEFKSGLYTTHILSGLERINYSSKYKSSFNKALLMGLNLKSDSTFTCCYCDHKLRKNGKWKFQNDTLILWNVYDFKLKKHVPEIVMLYEKETSYLIWSFVVFGQNDKNKKTATVLMINGERFDGVMD